MRIRMDIAAYSLAVSQDQQVVPACHVEQPAVAIGQREPDAFVIDGSEPQPLRCFFAEPHVHGKEHMVGQSSHEWDTYFKRGGHQQGSSGATRRAMTGLSDTL